MSALSQEIRFCRARDGVRVAYSTMGGGRPLVKAAHFLTHLEHDLRTPVWRPWLEELSRDRTLVRYDARGCGLSEREVSEVSLDKWVADLEAVVDAAGLDQFALFGGGQGAMTSIAYAVRHPKRVTRLVVYSGYARGLMKRNPTPEQVKHARLVTDLIEIDVSDLARRVACPTLVGRRSRSSPPPTPIRSWFEWETARCSSFLRICSTPSTPTRTAKAASA